MNTIHFSPGSMYISNGETGGYNLVVLYGAKEHIIELSKSQLVALYILLKNYDVIKSEVKKSEVIYDGVSVTESPKGFDIRLEAYNEDVWFEFTRSEFIEFASYFVSAVAGYDEITSETIERDMIGKAQEKLKAIGSEIIVYLPGNDFTVFDTERITNAAGEIMEALGYEVETEDEPILSSWFKRIKFVFKKKTTPEKIEDLFDKAQKALELKYVELPTAEQTEKLANATSKLVSSLDGVKEGLVRVGSILVLKKLIQGEPKLLIHHLTFQQLQKIESDPNILKSITQIYDLVWGTEDNKKIDGIETKRIGNADQTEMDESGAISNAV